MEIYQQSWFVTVATFISIFIIYLLYQLFKKITDKRQKLLESKIRESTAQLREEKEKLEIQKFFVETAKRNLTDSIRYAQRIQAAIIPTINELKTVFPEIFALFQPRDVISGDFYWYAKKDNLIYFAAVDCTGHGVPGAFMSLIGYAILEQLIDAKGLQNPSQILAETDKLIIKWLKQETVLEGLRSRDGMDMSLICIDYEQKQLHFSGAKNPIFIAQNGQVEEIKADKFALGGGEMDKHFTDTTIPFSEGDYIYLTSDGYIDQFGGKENKKFSKKRFVAELSQIYTRPAEEQYRHLLDTMKAWKGTHKQIDDMMVIGIRL